MFLSVSIVSGILIIVFGCLTFFVWPKVFYLKETKFVVDNEIESSIEADLRKKYYRVKDQLTANYIEGYSLVQLLGNTTLKCKLAEGVTSIEYEVVLFKNSKPINVVKVVDEKIEDYLSSTITLPNYVSKVSVRALKVNGKVIQKPAIKNKDLLKYSFCAGLVAFFITINMCCMGASCPLQDGMLFLTTEYIDEFICVIFSLITAAIMYLITSPLIYLGLKQTFCSANKIKKEVKIKDEKESSKNN